MTTVIDDEYFPVLTFIRGRTMDTLTHLIDPDFQNLFDETEWPTALTRTFECTYRQLLANTVTTKNIEDSSEFYIEVYLNDEGLIHIEANCASDDKLNLAQNYLKKLHCVS